MIAELVALVEAPPEDALTAMAALAAFVTVLAVWHALMRKDPVSARAGRLRRRQDELRAGLTAARRSRHRSETKAMGVMRALATRFNLLKSKSTAGAGERLMRAGWRSKDALVTFMVMKLLLPFAFGAVAFVLLDGLTTALPPALGNVAPLAAVLIGFYAPDVAVKNAFQKREKAVRKQLPDALDLLVICAEAGLSLDAALGRVAREMALAAPEIADEFGLTAVELSFLPDRKKALVNLTRRCRIEPVRGVVNTLMQTERYGTPLAHSLRVLAAEYRNERMLKAEEKAAKLPAVLTVPLIMFIMPALMVVLLGPAVLRLIDGLSKM